MRLHVVADDRTGALEVAAGLADRDASGASGVTVVVWPETAGGTDMDGAVEVVDLGSRHLTLRLARERAGSIEVRGAAAHKIDSTLRGNWAVELVARHRSGEFPVLVVPALPALGRTCVDGVVMVDGQPVDEWLGGSERRQSLESSRPADHLRRAGVVDPHELSTLDATWRWLDAPDGFAVADAIDDATIDAIVGKWELRPDVVLAGPSGVIAAAAGPAHSRLLGGLGGPVVVVCGSTNARARRQIDECVASGVHHFEEPAAAAKALARGEDVIVCSPMPLDHVTVEEAERMAMVLGQMARSVATGCAGLAAMVVLGGDTAAAVLGDEVALVRGSVAPGTAWVESPSFACPVITRSGAFGDDRALVDLLWGTLRP